MASIGERIWRAMRINSWQGARKISLPAAPAPAGPDMDAPFTAHNIRLDDGATTMSDALTTMDAYPVTGSTRRLFDLVFPGDRNGLRVADLGCLEGGFSVELARMGFEVLGVDVRETNIAACEFVRARVDLPRLSFARDDVWNIAKYGPFDAVFCSGLLYHLDRPRAFVKLLGEVARKAVVLQTHFATLDDPRAGDAGWGLSEAAEHEGAPGRWYAEFHDEAAFAARERNRWASWDNRRSFWPTREYLFQFLYEAGFDLVFEQMDGYGPDVGATTSGSAHRRSNRGTFVGVRSKA